MELYTLLMDAVVLLMIAVFIRHSLYRMRHFLHMFQQVGYKTKEFRQWLSENFYSRGFTTEHLLFNILLLLLIYFFAEDITLTAGTIIVGTFTLFWFVGVDRYREEKEKKPLVFTSRMKRLGSTYLIMALLLWYMLIDFGFSELQIRDFAGPFVNTDPYFMGFGLVLIDILIPLLLFLAAWIMKPVESYIQNGFKKQARKKLRSMPDLKVIAITGSYGKTSTKFVIDAFLKERMPVCVTPGSYNTPMGICKVINNDLEAHHRVLILEMGARYSGNIKELCDIAKPDVAVITNVGVSHLETFGSQEAIAEEKSTLAKELKKGGTLILNSDDERVKKMANLRNDVKILFAGRDGDIRSEDVKTGPEGTTFTMQWMNENGEIQEQEKINISLLGNHNIQNILLGAATAREFGVRLKTISVAASKMEPVEHRLELKQRNGLTVIDDAFNSNPVGAKSAVDVLASFKEGKKIIITPGMIELGDQEDAENEKLGRYIAEAGLDLVLLVGKEQTEAIKNGIEKTANGKIIDVRVVDTLFEANEILNDFAGPGDVVLYENDLPDTYNR